MIKEMLSVYLDMELEVSHPSLAYGQRISAISIMSTRDVYLAEVSMETPLFSLFVATLIILSTI